MSKDFTQNAWNIRHVNQTPSTQSDIKDWCDGQQRGSNQHYAVIADEQISGHGRHGRAWNSPKGNFYASMALAVRLPQSYLGLYAYIAALALHRASCHFIDVNGQGQLKLKWPNDLILDDKKAAGILIDYHETSHQAYIIMGIGVNLNHAPEQRAFLKSYAGGDDIKALDFLKTLLNELDRLTEDFTEMNARALIHDWQEKAWRLDEMITVKLGENHIQGRFDHIDEKGSLVLNLANGQKRIITAGQLYFGDEKDDVSSD